MSTLQYAKRHSLDSRREYRPTRSVVEQLRRAAVPVPVAQPVPIATPRSEGGSAYAEEGRKTRGHSSGLWNSGNYITASDEEIIALLTDSPPLRVTEILAALGCRNGQANREVLSVRLRQLETRGRVKVQRVASKERKAVSPTNPAHQVNGWVAVKRRDR